MFLFVEMGEGGRGVNMKMNGPGRVKSSQVYGQMQGGGSSQGGGYDTFKGWQLVNTGNPGQLENSWGEGGGTPGFIPSITPWLVEGWGRGSVDKEVEDEEGCGGEGHNSYPVKLSDNH